MHEKLRLKVYQPRDWELGKNIFTSKQLKKWSFENPTVQSSLSCIVLEATNEALGLTHGL